MSAPDILPAGETALPAARDVESAYAWCRQIAHRYGSNFSVGFRFLPREKRRAVYAAYAFCRLADDIADGAGHAIGSDCHPERSEGSRRPASQILRCAQDDRQSLQTSEGDG
ncbi:MAG TPA: hypothetical protein DHV65_02680 [Ktedonobacter sp.]|nr:hypothetical protein [Ktedonobacter sp.]